MSESESYGDAFNEQYWRAATQRQLKIQHCRECNHYQFYGRPFCLGCVSDVEWVRASPDYAKDLNPSEILAPGKRP